MASEYPAAAGIVGTYDVTNYGDLLFPLIAQAELDRRIPGLRLDIYSPTVPPAPWPFPVLPSEALATDAARLSALLVGGGQLVRFDPIYPVALPEGTFAPDAYCLHPVLAARAAGTPIVWNAIGAWAGSPACPVREPILGQAIARSAIIAVRDEPTRALFTRLAPRAAIELVPDTAFGLSTLWPKGPDTPEQARWRAQIDLKGPYMVVQADRRIARFRDVLAGLQERLGLRIVVLPVCYCHGDRAEGFPALPGDADRLGGWPAPHRIREIIAGAELVVATSLHACITALAYGVRVARVSYPYERKFEQLESFSGIARLDDPADLERLLARGNGIEERVLDHQETLAAYWDRVAALIALNRRSTAQAIELPVAPAPAYGLPAKVAARAAAGRLARGIVRQVRGLVDPGRPAAFRNRPVLDLNAIRGAAIHDEPFRWGRQAGLFAPDDARLLADGFPTRGFWTIAGVEPGRHYRFIARSLIAMGADHPHGPRGLSDAWRAFALDLLSPEYRAAVSEAVGLDLRDAVMEANITQYGRGHELSPHLDLKEKLVTQIFYFNEDWEVEDGGCLAIMRDREAGSEAALIPPLLGTSAILVRSHRSWHRVTPVREGLNRARRSLNVIFHLPGSKSTMWPQWPIAARRTLRRWVCPVPGEPAIPQASAGKAPPGA